MSSVLDLGEEGWRPHENSGRCFISTQVSTSTRCDQATTQCYIVCLLASWPRAPSIRVGRAQDRRAPLTRDIRSACYVADHEKSTKMTRAVVRWSGGLVRVW